MKGLGDSPHLCLVHEPLSHSVETVRCLDVKKRLEPHLVKAAARQMLQALDFLHSEAGVVHGGIVLLEAHQSVHG